MMRSTAGSVRLREAAGEADLKTTAGNIDVGVASGRTYAHTRAGNIRIDRHTASAAVKAEREVISGVVTASVRLVHPSWQASRILTAGSRRVGGPLSGDASTATCGRGGHESHRQTVSQIEFRGWLPLPPCPETSSRYCLLSLVGNVQRPPGVSSTSDAAKQCQAG